MHHKKKPQIFVENLRRKKIGKNFGTLKKKCAIFFDEITIEITKKKIILQTWKFRFHCPLNKVYDTTRTRKYMQCKQICKQSTSKAYMNSSSGFCAIFLIDLLWLFFQIKDLLLVFLFSLIIGILRLDFPRFFRHFFF